MRISRVYIDTPLSTQSKLKLKGDSAHYLATVLRLRDGDSVTLFNGSDGEFKATIVQCDRKNVELEIDEQLKAFSVPTLAINLGLGLSRGDRMDYAIQKSTELGASCISPIYSQYGEVKIKPDRMENRLNHWRKIVCSACEQSGRQDLPDVNAPCSIADWYQSCPPGVNVLLNPGGTDAWPEATNSIQNINLLIGPEGGFSVEEIAQARGHNFLVLSLGERILRTETAPVAALSILQHRYGDM